MQTIGGEVQLDPPGDRCGFFSGRDSETCKIKNRSDSFRFASTRLFSTIKVHGQVCGRAFHECSACCLSLHAGRGAVCLSTETTLTGLGNPLLRPQLKKEENQSKTRGGPLGRIYKTKKKKKSTKGDALCARASQECLNNSGGPEARVMQREERGGRRLISFPDLGQRFIRTTPRWCVWEQNISCKWLKKECRHPN